jgi:competence protein ComEC
LPCLSVELRPVSAAWVVMWFVALTSVAWAVGGSRWRKWLAGVAVVLLIGMSIWSQRTITPPAGAIELVMLNIGAGQCIVLQDDSGKTILLDAGTRNGYDAFGTILAPFLRSQHWPAPATAIVSHANADHYNMLGELARDGSLRKLAVCSYYADGTHADAVARGLLKLARNCGVTQSTLRPGDRITLGDQTTIDVLWPVPGLTDVSENDTSLVLKLTHRGQRVLFPGDIGEIPQCALLAHPERILADVLVLPHHGAWQKSLPEFVAAVNPSVILVSAARDPSGPSNAKPAVGEFYQSLKRDYRYRSTANSGAIRLMLTEDGVQIRTMR